MKKARQKRRALMEAGGIEPPSRCTSAWASTCVVGLFHGAELLADQPTGHPRAEPGCFSFARRQAAGRPKPSHARTSLQSTSGTASRRRGPTGCLVRQPNGSHHWHVIGVPGVLRGLLTTSTRHPDLNLPGRSQSPPAFGALPVKEHRAHAVPIDHRGPARLTRVYARRLPGNTKSDPREPPPDYAVRDVPGGVSGTRSSCPPRSVAAWPAISAGSSTSFRPCPRTTT